MRWIPIGLCASLAAVIAMLAITDHAQAQECFPNWQRREGIPGITRTFGDTPTFKHVVWDPDGAGPAEPVLVIAGPIEAAGSHVVSGGLALWDGNAWSTLPEPTDRERLVAEPSAIAIFRGELFVSGAFALRGGQPTSALARWTGSEWQYVGYPTPYLSSMTEFDGELVGTGSIPDLTGDPAISTVGAWNGTRWRALNPAPFAGRNPTDFKVAHGRLYASGAFLRSRGSAFDLVAGWDGATWMQLASGLGPDGTATPIVLGTAVYQDRFIVFGRYRVENDQNIRNAAMWNGQEWRAMGGSDSTTSFTSPLSALERDGNLYLAGGFSITQSSDLVQNFAIWDGAVWRRSSITQSFSPLSLAQFRGELMASGTGVGIVGIGRYDGQAWRPMGSGTNAAIHAAISVDDRVIVGGDFVQAGPIAANRVAAFDGSSWSPLGNGLDGSVRALVVHEGRIVAGGTFMGEDHARLNGVAAWDGREWSPLGEGLIRNIASDRVETLLSHQGDLFAGGCFTTSRGSPANNIARWDGTAWRPVGDGLASCITSVLIKDGQLLAGGGAGLLPGTDRPAVVSWDGASWSSVGAGMRSNGFVRKMINHQGTLVVSGQISTTTPPIASGIAMLENGNWVAIGGGLGIAPTISALASHDGSLFASGSFSGGSQGRYLSRWDGLEWNPMGGLDGGAAEVMISWGQDLFLGGAFTSAWDTPAAFSATLNFHGPPIVDVEWTGEYPATSGCGTTLTLYATVRYNRVPFDLQWFYNGVPLTDGPRPWATVVSGVHSDTLRLTNIHERDAGVYSFVASSTCGSTASEFFELAPRNCCVADVSDGSERPRRDQGVTIDDLLTYLTWYSAGNTLADIDDGTGRSYPDGAVTIEDLLYFLARYVAGC